MILIKKNEEIFYKVGEKMYKVPSHCDLPESKHKFMGGCWGIANGDIEKKNFYHFLVKIKEG